MFDIGYALDMKEIEVSGVMSYLYRDDKPVRTANGPDGEPWFVLADLCTVLEIRNVSQARGRLDTDEVALTTLDRTGGPGNRNASIVSEAGMYELVLSSRTPEAAALKRWITHDVLPAIRKTGRYLTPEAVEEVQELRRNLQHRAEIIRTDLANGRTRGALSTLDAMLYEVDNEYLACLVTASRTQL